MFYGIDTRKREQNVSNEHKIKNKKNTPRSYVDIYIAHMNMIGKEARNLVQQRGSLKICIQGLARVERQPVIVANQRLKKGTKRLIGLISGLPH